MNKTLKKIINIFTTLLVILVILLAVLLVGARVIGLQVFTVLSGSMEPTYQTGSLIYVKKLDPKEIMIGDPITFVMDESLTVATHRVIEIDAENQHFYTKGDANEVADGSPVHYNNLLGKPIFTIPYLGYVANYIQNPPGMYVSIAIGALILLLVFLPDLFSSDNDNKKRRKPVKGRRNSASPVSRNKPRL